MNYSVDINGTSIVVYYIDITRCIAYTGMYRIECSVDTRYIYSSEDNFKWLRYTINYVYIF